MSTPGMISGVPGKNPEDARLEDRARAHIRERLAKLEIGVTEAAELCGVSQSALSRILAGGRGLGLGIALRIVDGLGLDLTQVVLRDPAPEWWRPVVPQAPARISRRRKT